MHIPEYEHFEPTIGNILEYDRNVLLQPKVGTDTDLREISPCQWIEALNLKVDTLAREHRASRSGSTVTEITQINL